MACIGGFAAAVARRARLLSLQICTLGVLTLRHLHICMQLASLPGSMGCDPMVMEIVEAGVAAREDSTRPSGGCFASGDLGGACAGAARQLHVGGAPAVPEFAKPSSPEISPLTGHGQRGRRPGVRSGAGGLEAEPRRKARQAEGRLAAQQTGSGRAEARTGSG